MSNNKEHRKIIKKASKLLGEVLDEAGVPESHGLGHALKVLENLRQALSSNEEAESKQIDLPAERQLALQLGALLHDADDKKYFPECKNYENAVSIMSQALKDLDKKLAKLIKKETLEMISYVSASDNGNTVPERALTNPEFLWVRYADRLEAIGTIGAVRCYQYNSEKGADLCCETTPRCKSKEEVWSHVTPDRLEKYMATKTSDSMMDHYFDKLLQIALFDKKTVCNEWLCAEAERRVDPLL